MKRKSAAQRYDSTSSLAVKYGSVGSAVLCFQKPCGSFSVTNRGDLTVGIWGLTIEFWKMEVPKIFENDFWKMEVPKIFEVDFWEFG